METLYNLVKLYLPLSIGIVCLIVMFIVKKGEKGTVIKLRPFGDFIELESLISNLILAKVIFAALAVLALSLYLFYDYSSFFPQHLRMEVFFDQAGIEESLEEFSSGEQSKLGISQNYHYYQEQYFDNLNSQAQTLLHIPKFFGIREGSVHSTGQTSFLIERVGGWQKYHISESKGELTHIIEIPNLPQKQLYTLFDKLPSKDDYITPSFADIFFRHCVLIRPQFKQILAEDRKSDGVLFKISIVGATKVSIFPWPSMGRTIYCADFRDAGLVPIAYAIYQ